MVRFQDREQAAEALASALTQKQLNNVKNACLLAMPRGGVPIASILAKRLGLPWDIVLVKKIAAPYHPEFALGAVCEDGYPVWNEEALSLLGLGKEQLLGLAQKTHAGIQDQARNWRGDRHALDVKDRTVILVDDGIATGMTMRAAIHSANILGAKKVLVAAPVCSLAAEEALLDLCDGVVTLSVPDPFFSVGEWYESFDQVNDDIVMRLLQESVEPAESAVHIPANGGFLRGLLRVPSRSRGLIIFAHGSGSSHTSPRNRTVAEALNRFGFSTLLFDLLMPEESHDRDNIFDIPFLGARLINATDWVREQKFAFGVPIGYFGASTGAAAALVAASQDGEIASVVCRGGRPDLAEAVLHLVKCPVLLIVGGEDHGVLELNERAKERLANGGMVIVPGATHLFEEPGALDEAVQYAVEWFQHTMPVQDMVAEPLDLDHDGP